MFEGQVAQLTTFLEHVVRLNERYRAGEVHAYVPEALRDSQRTLEELVAQHSCRPPMRRSKAASRRLFFSLPVAFDPRNRSARILRRRSTTRPVSRTAFLDMGALIATQAFGENDPDGGPGRARIAAVCHLALRAFGVPDRPVTATEGRAEPHRAGWDTTPLHRQHRRRNGGTRSSRCS